MWAPCLLAAPPPCPPSAPCLLDTRSRGSHCHWWSENRPAPLQPAQVEPSTGRSLWSAGTTWVTTGQRTRRMVPSAPAPAPPWRRCSPWATPSLPWPVSRREFPPADQSQVTGLCSPGPWPAPDTPLCHQSSSPPTPSHPFTSNLTRNHWDSSLCLSNLLRSEKSPTPTSSCHPSLQCSPSSNKNQPTSGSSPAPVTPTIHSTLATSPVRMWRNLLPLWLEIVHSSVATARNPSPHSQASPSISNSTVLIRSRERHPANIVVKSTTPTVLWRCTSRPTLCPASVISVAKLSLDPGCCRDTRELTPERNHSSVKNVPEPSLTNQTCEPTSRLISRTRSTPALAVRKHFPAWAYSPNTTTLAASVFRDTLLKNPLFSPRQAFYDLNHWA